MRFVSADNRQVSKVWFPLITAEELSDPVAASQYERPIVEAERERLSNASRKYARDGVWAGYEHFSERTMPSMPSALHHIAISIWN